MMSKAEFDSIPDLSSLIGFLSMTNSLLMTGPEPIISAAEFLSIPSLSSLSGFLI